MACGVISYEFRGVERLGRPGQLIIANHPTLIDVVLIVAFTPAPCCVVKAALFRNPFTRAGRAGGGIHQQQSHGRDDPRRRRRPALWRLTRHVPGGHPHSTRPATALSTAGRPASPYRLQTFSRRCMSRCEPLLLPKFVPWYRVPPRRPHLTLEVGEDIDLAPTAACRRPGRRDCSMSGSLQHFTGKARNRSGGYNGEQPRGP